VKSWLSCDVRSFACRTKTSLHSSPSFTSRHLRSSTTSQLPSFCTTLRHLHTSHPLRVTHYQQPAQTWRPRTNPKKMSSRLLSQPRPISAHRLHPICKFSQGESRCTRILTTYSVAFRVTNDEAYLERSQTLVKHAMPDIAEHLAKNAKLLTLMYADGKLRHKDCKPALAEIKVRVIIPDQIMFRQLICIFTDVALGV
jgi:hypothetical protein